VNAGYSCHSLGDRKGIQSVKFLTLTIPKTFGSPASLEVNEERLAGYLQIESSSKALIIGVSCSSFFADLDVVQHLAGLLSLVLS